MQGEFMSSNVKLKVLSSDTPGGLENLLAEFVDINEVVLHQITYAAAGTNLTVRYIAFIEYHLIEIR